MQVDGRPSVRTCIEPARDGQIVTRQNAWPSADTDLLRVFDRLDHFLPVGFYYKSFHKPRWIWPIFEHVVRHIAGLGRIDVTDLSSPESEVEHLHTDVCVVGAGPAGLAAAATAARAGCQVLLVERSREPGGDVRHADACELLKSDLQAFQQSSSTALYETSAFGVYEGNLVGAFQASRLLKIRARQIIIATGGRERPFVFHNNDLPGIMLGAGALRLARWSGTRPGRRAVVLTDDDRGHEVAAALERVGVEIAAVVDTRPDGQLTHLASNKRPIHGGSTVVAASGRSHLREVRVARLQDDGQVAPNTQHSIQCDLLCMASALVPANELLLQAGVRFGFNGSHWSVSQSVSGVWAAGAAAGTMDVDAQIMEGHLRGAEASHAIGRPVPSLDQLRREWEARCETMREREARLDTRPPSTGGDLSGKRFVCLCEDVTEKDLVQAVAEGFDGIETLKRYSTVSMGPCQGKMCGSIATDVCARATGRSIGAVGTTTSRPPAVPVDLCVLAAASHQPIRRTALHHWHDAAGARWMDAGQWKRPESYGEPATEVLAVRSGVGLIDVSTLGKIEVVGSDATELLERVYINKWSDLKVGRARYGVMCNEDGIVFDDGVCARLERNRFYLTATTGNAEGVYQWLELWRDTWGLDAKIFNRTSGFAAMNLAGPRAREVLSRVTTLDLAHTAFPYMAVREAEAAGVPCRLLRIGFVGELGYEIHCPAALAWPLWEAIIDAGREFDLKPFGVEAQRILRLEKGHIIVGADTDALSNPLEAGLESLVRFDKPQFIGRTPLVRMKERGLRSRLIGFFVLHSKQAVQEGSQVVDKGYPIGRVTSARVSPTIGVSLGLAWVPVGWAATGSRFLIRWNGSDMDAIVARVPFYDPQGERLRM
jgi:sarcosine oxidase subunit alpha